MPNDAPTPTNPDDELSFTHAQPATSPSGSAEQSTMSCVGCARPIADTYFAAGDRVVCPLCREQYVAATAGGSGSARLMKAGLLGLGAAIVGAAVWYGIRIATESDFGLIAVGVGLLVGAAVRAGAQRRGGIGYQLLAIVLTYLTIASSYIPHLITEAQNNPDGSAPLAVLVPLAAVVSLAVPVMAGMDSPILLLIYAFALWEAWKMNTRQVVELQGPYTLNKPVSGADPTSPAAPGPSA